MSLLGGPATGLGVTAGSAAAALLGPREVRPAAAAAMMVAGSATAVGVADDLVGVTAVKGLGGHLRALRAGTVTTGSLKVLVVGLSGLSAAAMLGGGPVSVVLGGGVVAGAANLVNLLDLRPGRALKVAVGLGVPLLTLSMLSGTARGGGVPAAASLGAASVVLPLDLGEEVMIGDAGANAVGAALGVGLIAAAGPRGRAGLLASLVALTLASERWSFSAVIEETPPLRRLDQLGRC